MTTKTQAKTPSAAPAAWDDLTLVSMTLHDLCHLDLECVDAPNLAPLPFIASGPTLVIESVTPDPTSPDGMTYEEPLGHVVLTPHGAVLRLEHGTHQGTVRNQGNGYAEIVYGSREALQAIGAADITPLPCPSAKTATEM